MTLPPNGPSHESVDISEEPPAGAKRGGELPVNSLHISEGNKFERKLTLTVTSFFSSAFPSGNFSPKHMLIVYSGDPPLFSLNSFSSGHRQDAQQQQMTERSGRFFFQTSATAHTMHILGKAEDLHHDVLGQLTGLQMSPTGIARAGEHVAPVLPRGVDTGVPYLQQESFLDAAEDAVGVFNLG